METQSNIFVPKYRLITYLIPVALLGALGIWVALVAFVSAISYGFSYTIDDWKFIGLPIVFLVIAIIGSISIIIKEIEFSAETMTVRYYIGWTWSIGYHKINKVVANQIIDTQKRRITLSNMTNGTELESRVLDILRNRKIQALDAS